MGVPTTKHQCQGPVSWADRWRELAPGGSLGDGMRVALAYALSLPKELAAFAAGHSVDAEGQVTSRLLADVLVAPEPDLARAVVEVVEATNGDRDAEMMFGSRKFFISGVWNKLRKLPAWRKLELGEFKRRLVELHRSQDLVLARADLVAAMDPVMVAASEATTDGATFHFVVYGEGRAWGKPSGDVSRLPGWPLLFHELVNAAADVVLVEGQHEVHRHGAEKAFIAAVFEKLKGRPGLDFASLAAFKRRLVVELRESRVVLARADIPVTKDGKPLPLLAASEIESLGDTFHYVQRSSSLGQVKGARALLASSAPALRDDDRLPRLPRLRPGETPAATHRSGGPRKKPRKKPTRKTTKPTTKPTKKGRKP